MNILSNFGDFINEHMLRQEISIFELSKRIGIDDFVISRWQKEKYMPSLDNLIKIADYFNVPIDFMLGLSESSTLIRFEPPKQFIDQLCSLMQEKQITAYHLAKECGIGRSGVSKWVHGHRMPSFENIVAVAQYLGCSVDYLIGRGH